MIKQVNGLRQIAGWITLVAFMATLTMTITPVQAESLADSTYAQTPEQKPDSVSDSTIVPALIDQFIAYYFHGTQRCVTCRKLETYSEEALNDGFAERLADSSLVWQLVNYDLEENEHFIKEYGLFTKAVILSRVRDGEQIAWTNLDKIWQLVGDKEEFVSYIQTQTVDFMKDVAGDE